MASYLMSPINIQHDKCLKVRDVDDGRGVKSGTLSYTLQFF